MDFAYSVSGSQQAALKKVLEIDPYDKDSFSTVGYTLRDSASLGLPAGTLVLHYSCNDSAISDKLKSRLAAAAIPDLKPLTGPDLEKVVGAIKSSEDQAASGFGSIFG
jgi:hypothetical protein